MNARTACHLTIEEAIAELVRRDAFSCDATGVELERRWSERLNEWVVEGALELADGRCTCESLQACLIEKLGAGPAWLLGDFAKRDCEAEDLLGFHDAHLNARHWFSVLNVSADEAAMLLCRFDPLESRDPGTLSTDETSPADFELLRRMFRDQDGKARGLLEWLDLASTQQLKYHSWIDSYLAAYGAVSPDEAIRPALPETMTTGRSYWSVLLWQSMSRIDRDGPGSARDAIRCLKASGDRRILSDGGPDELKWRDDSGAVRTVTKKTVSNALSLARATKK